MRQIFSLIVVAVCLVLMISGCNTVAQVDLVALERRVTTLETDNTSLKSKVVALENREVTFQTGYISKKPASEPLGNGWTPITAPDGSKTFVVTFNEVFAEKPQVVVSPVQIEDYGNRGGTFYAIRMSQDNVTRGGFTFTVDGSYSESFSNLSIQWLAIGYKSK
jgi:outer membrane murein-binding lipoprotein Lpp